MLRLVRLSKEGSPMARQALYRKWRSQTFDEIVGQEHVTRTLKNALRAGRIGHAYLFTGPRGTGKTSTARILAKAVNCEAPLEERPCGTCHMCRSIAEGHSLDLIEIDAASNTSVDDIRDLREKVGFAPAEGRFKVYIIDEVHMLSNSAFNALLKTLEEPPAHVIFVLATTEVHKVPATVLSRCQRFDFQRIPVEKIRAHLAYILDAEGVAYEPDALDIVARQATGSLRDALSLLDQLLASGGGTLTVQIAREVLGVPHEEHVLALLQAIQTGDAAAGFRAIRQALDRGSDARQFLAAILEHLRALLILRLGGVEELPEWSDDHLAQLRVLADGLTPHAIMQSIRAFQQAGADLKLGLSPQLPLEVAFAEALLAGQQRNERVEPRPQSSHSATAAPRATTRAPEPVGDSSPPPPPPETKAVATKVVSGDDAIETDSQGHDLSWWQTKWPEFLEWLNRRGDKGKRLAVRLKFGEPYQLDGNTLTLRFAHSIHKDKVEEPETRGLVQRAVKSFGGAPLSIRCVWIPDEQMDAPRTKTKYEEAAEDPLIQTAMKMGARIVDVYMPNEIPATDEGGV
ncbi:MAG: DNA polymerase III subunit gamma/tau [Ardenticatenia bacterium]|nr:MAG: DNA polymerase III subunit gamma/tau [Ardenticatenia bacterium]